MTLLLLLNVEFAGGGASVLPAADVGHTWTVPAMRTVWTLPRARRTWIVPPRRREWET